MIKRPAIITGGTVVFCALLCSGIVFADDDASVDDVSIVVPTACTLSGTGTGTHTATINPGQYVTDIGTTTLKAICNDANGFAIYATGYTGNTIGETNSNKLVGQNTSETIVTGLATSGDTSNWAMKLATDPNATYPVTIESAPNTSGGSSASFASYHVIPNEYTKVATRLQSTDVGTTATGSTLTTTYATYISAGQVGDTYNGKVIYTLVHPNNSNPPVGENRIGVIYDGNGLFFDQIEAQSTNKVIYEKSCEDEYGYIGDTPAILKTRNLNNDGTQNGPYSYEGSTYYEGDGFDTDYVDFEGASRVKIVIRYGLTQNTAFGPDISVDGYSVEDEAANNMANDNVNRSGTVTYVLDGSSVGAYLETGNVATTSGYDYGVYIQVYPIYDEPTEGASYDVIQNICSFSPVIGTYAETTTWNNKWYVVNDDGKIGLNDETAVEDYLIRNDDDLLGSTINLYAYNPYKITYNGNGATAGTMSGFYTALIDNTASSTADLMAYNFKKTGYGFAGWSADQNATVNNSSKIYGPNEMIAGNELIFDNNRETILYAVWVPSVGNMQSFSCSSLGSGQVTALTDTRDNNVYTVGKFADGNCWMMENLRLDAANSSDSSKAQGFGGNFTGLANSEDTNFEDSPASNSKYSTSNITSGNRGYRFPRYNNNNTNIGGTNSFGTTLVATPGLWDGRCYINLSNHCGDQLEEGENNYTQWYGYGNYYTWASAMANTSNLNSVSSSEAVNTSICPSGWSLPYGGNTGNGAVSGGFSYLDVQLGGTGDINYDVNASSRWRSYPYNFVYSGSWIGTTAGRRGGFGFYWSRTANSGFSSAHLSFQSYYVAPGTGAYTNKYVGISVRCLTQ